MIWWHRRVLGHRVSGMNVSVPAWGWARGELYRCECGKVWAK